MRHVIIALILCTLPASAMAQATPKDDTPLIDGLDELADGMRKLFENFSDDVAPMMEDLAEQLKGLDTYHAPEVLPNGDIIIRRKTPKQVETPPETDTDSIIDI